MQEPLDVKFGPFRLDVRNEQLWRGPEVLRLTNKAFAVLCYLIKHSGQLVTKDELFAAVWPGVVVGDSALVVCIRELRQALGDERRTPQFIETVHGRGYRFVGTVVSGQLSVVSQEEVALPLPDKPSIVVLPFVNLSSDPTQEYFSDGITEEITSALSHLASLFVIARTSAFAYKGKGIKVQDISREMGVRYVLEGSVRKADAQLRVIVQLIDATTGGHLWTEHYDHPLTDIFAVQDAIVQKIVTTLNLQLTLRAQGIFVRKHTDSLEAYDYFLRGLEYRSRFTKEANAQARLLFEHAVAVDPQYAAAYVGLGWTYYQEWIWRWRADPRSLERSLTLAQQALVLDDSLPIAHSLLSNVYYLQQQYEQAMAEGERAIALNPNNADSHIAQAEVLNLAGRPKEALRAVEQAMRLNPHYPPVYLFELGFAYRLTGRYAEAIAALKKALDRNPHLMTAHLELALSYLLQWVTQQNLEGQTLEPAGGAVQRALALNDSLHWSHIFLGYIFLYQQQHEQALAEMAQAVALAPAEPMSHAALAEVLSYMGKSEKALETVAQTLGLKSFFVDGHLNSVGSTYYLTGRTEEAISPLKRYLTRYPNRLDVHLTLAAVYGELGKDAEAQAEVAEVLRINPKFSLEVHKERVPIKDPAALERHIAALRKAGLK